jgi:predicted alpha/beta-fold hydrolase
MPIIETSSYKASFFISNRHVNTIVHALLRRVKIEYARKRLSTPDDDFIDIDYSVAGKQKGKKVVVIIHGLEGSSNSSYIKGMVKESNGNGLDAVAINFRGCSGDQNNTFGSYHSGSTEDVAQVVKHLKNVDKYEEIFLVSYSLGANVMLKYMGEEGDQSLVKASVAVSVPSNLEDCAVKLEKWYNKAYLIAFLRSLRKKVVAKCKTHPNHIINLKAVLKATSFTDFDNEFTAPAHGFKNAQDYWDRSSCQQFLSQIKQPTLIINALDDPFLTPSCYPYSEATNSKFLFLETPRKGGHVGFVSKIFSTDAFWHEKRTISFFRDND